MQEVTSFPVDKVSVGESPSVAMHVPVAVIREAQRGPPPDAAAMANAARNNRGANGRGAANADRTPDEPFTANAASDDALLRFPEWEGWTEPSVALTLRAAGKARVAQEVLLGLGHLPELAHLAQLRRLHHLEPPDLAPQLVQVLICIPSAAARDAHVHGHAHALCEEARLAHRALVHLAVGPVMPNERRELLAQSLHLARSSSSLLALPALLESWW